MEPEIMLRMPVGESMASANKGPPSNVPMMRMPRMESMPAVPGG